MRSSRCGSRRVYAARARSDRPSQPARPRGRCPGSGLLGTVGYAAVAAFPVLHLDERDIGHGAEVFTAFAATVVAARVFGGWLPDRFGPAPCVAGAGLVEAAGLVAILLAESLPVAIAGALAMGAAFSLLFPSRPGRHRSRPEERRGARWGRSRHSSTWSRPRRPAAGAAAAIGGYLAAFALAAAAALATVALATTLRLVAAGERSAGDVLVVHLALEDAEDRALRVAEDW